MTSGARGQTAPPSLRSSSAGLDFVGLGHKISELVGFGGLHRPVPDVKYANRLGFMMNGEVDLIAAVALAMEQKANLRLKILRFFGLRTPLRQLVERPDRSDKSC